MAWKTLFESHNSRALIKKQADIPGMFYLRCDVVRCTAECGGSDTIQNALLAHAKVGKLAVALSI